MAKMEVGGGFIPPIWGWFYTHDHFIAHYFWPTFCSISRVAQVTHPLAEKQNNFCPGRFLQNHGYYYWTREKGPSGSLFPLHSYNYASGGLSLDPSALGCTHRHYSCPPPPRCISYANVRNYYGPFTHCTNVRLGNPSCDHTPCGTIAHAHHLKMPLAEA